MIDPVALNAVAASSGAPAANAPQSTPAPAQQFEKTETRMFANLMQGAQQASANASAPSSLHDAAMAYASQFSGNTRSLEEMRHTMLESIDMKDPIKTMFVMTDQSMQAQMLFAKMHISTGLASAATSLFGTLLKNQQ